jgi:hypothetical protein
MQVVPDHRPDDHAIATNLKFAVVDQRAGRTEVTSSDPHADTNTREVFGPSLEIAPGQDRQTGWPCGDALLQGFVCPFRYRILNAGVEHLDLGVEGNHAVIRGRTGDHHRERIFTRHRRAATVIGPALPSPST